MEKQIINNGMLLIEKGNLVHLRAKNGNQMIFHCVEIDHGYLILEPLDRRSFETPEALNNFIVHKEIVKGVIAHASK